MQNNKENTKTHTHITCHVQVISAVELLNMQDIVRILLLVSMYPLLKLKQNTDVNS